MPPCIFCWPESAALQLDLHRPTSIKANEKRDSTGHSRAALASHTHTDADAHGDTHTHTYTHAHAHIYVYICINIQIKQQFMCIYA